MKQNRKLTKVLLMVYLLALTWIILFKLQMDFSNLRDMNYRSVNLIPFAGSGIVNDRVVGIGVFAVLYRVFGRKVIKVLNVLALIGTVAAVAFLALLVIANL